MIPKAILTFLLSTVLCGTALASPAGTPRLVDLTTTDASSSTSHTNAALDDDVVGVSPRNTLEKRLGINCRGSSECTNGNHINTLRALICTSMSRLEARYPTALQPLMRLKRAAGMRTKSSCNRRSLSPCPFPSLLHRLVHPGPPSANTPPDTIRNTETFASGENIACDQASDWGGGAFCVFLQGMGDTKTNATTIKDKLKEINEHDKACNTCGSTPMYPGNNVKDGQLTVNYVGSKGVGECKGRKVCRDEAVRSHEELLKEG
jgi:hypothetical protein